MENYEKRNRIREALAIRNMKQVELSEKTGIHKGTINNWLNNRYQPKQKAIMLMANALDVNEMWLAGYDTPMERPAERVKLDKLARSINVVRKDEKLTDLMINITQLNEQQRTILENMVSDWLKLNQLSQ